jgi:transcriptional regulator with XRE-family HTH domain
MIRRIRKNKGLTLVKLGEKSDLSVSFLSDVERGKVKPSMESLTKLASTLGVNVDELVQELENERSSGDERFPPGFDEFLAEFNEVDEEIRDLLLQIENRSASRPTTKEDWIRLYYSVQMILR